MTHLAPFSRFRFQRPGRALARFEADRQRMLHSFSVWAIEAPLPDMFEEACATSSALQQLILLAEADAEVAR
jgi:hypothetical protein